MKRLLFSFERSTDLSEERRSGDDGKVVTPVPIPNTEVKHFHGDNSWARPSEDSKSPGDLTLTSL